MAGVLKGDIYFIDFGLNTVPSREQEGFRPALIVSSDLVNSKLPVITVAPITTKIKDFTRGFSMILEAGNPLTLKSEVLLFQMRAFDKRKLIRKIGELDRFQHEELNFLIRAIFDT